MSKELYEASLYYHQYPQPGKISVMPTKPLSTQRDLALAYSPGVASSCQKIAENPQSVADYTCRSNLVGVITNGTAVLGLGAIGPLAAKPVMEGKAVLFKKFAGIDVFDIEINETDPDKIVDIIASLEPTFGGINLEDIKAPECFYIERQLQKRLKIPVFHDDQHGTAIIVSAAVLNGLLLVNKAMDTVKIVTSGAGAAALACLGLLEKIGIQRKNIFVTDIDGVVYQGRTTNMDEDKAPYAQDTPHRCLKDLLVGADIFLGLSAGNILTPDMLLSMNPDPIILALANPTPEIDPYIACQTRPDAIVATGRSDFVNQVNNVLCFPFIFRGALDVGATCINDDMKLAAVEAIAKLARVESSDIVNSAYNTEGLRFGRDYIIPKPFDPRLILGIAPAVAKAAMDTGVATRQLDLESYKQKVSEHVFKSGLAMKPIFCRAKANKRRVAFADGEEERILQAVQEIVDEDLAHPILIGRRRVIDFRLERLGLRLIPDKDFTLVDPEQDPRFPLYWGTYHYLMERKGVSPDFARTIVRTNTTVIAALMVHLKEADAMIAGPTGRYNHHLESIKHLMGQDHPLGVIASLSALVMNQGLYFITDGYVNADPSPEELAGITLLAATHVKEFGITPKVALLSHSSFGTSTSPSAIKLQKTLKLIRVAAPQLEIDGEMHGDAALNSDIRQQVFPNSLLEGEANLLVMPNIDAANISTALLRCLADAQSIGPILMGLAKSAHILTPSTTVRGILNMTAFAVIDALRHEALAKKETLSHGT